jgi:hypothetical protein
MKKSIIALSLLLAAPFSLAGTETVQGARDCDTVTVNGGFFKGKQYKSSSFVAGVSTADAMKRASQSLVGSGWKIAQADEKLGVISADTTVSYGSGKTAPLSIAFAEKEGGLNVNISFATSGGVSSKTSDVAAQFCSIVDAVAAK